MRTRLLVALVLAGCTEHGTTQPPLASIDLRAAMETPDVRPVGVALAPDGHRFVFDENAGLYRMDGETAVLVVPLAAMPNPGPTAPVELPYTDMVAIAPNVFAIAAIGDGYLLDTAAMTLRQHFCYVPDDLPQSFEQRTDAIAYDPVRQRIYAQPLTYDAAGVFQFAQVAAYEAATGVDVAWFAANDVAATGAVVHDGALLLGQGSKLSRFDMDQSRSILLDDLARFGVQSIDGLVIDDGVLVVVDQQTDTMFEIDLPSLSL